MNFRLPYFFTIFLAGLLTFACGSDPEPDLEPDPELSILVQPSDENLFSEGLLVGGQDIMLTASVSHAGDPGSEATQLQFYRSKDAAISTDDSPEGERPVEALSSGASVDVNITVTLPSEVGSYYYGACITLPNFHENCSPGLEIIVSEVTQVTPGSMTESSLPAGGSNYFLFTLESTQGMAIHTSGRVDTTGRLYDGDGALVATNFNSGESGNFRLDRPLVSGTYFIRVSGNDMSTAGSYTLHLERSDVTTLEVNPMTAPTYTLAAGGSHYFQLALESTQFLVIYSRGTTYTTGRLYDSSGVPLATDFKRGGGGNFRIDRPLAPGTYFLRVHGAFQSVAGDYTLHVEGGDITTIEPGSTAEDTLTNSRYSHFQFTLESAQGMTIFASGGSRTLGRLYDSDGVELAAHVRISRGNFRFVLPLPAGTYFIQVQGGFPSIMDSYTLHVMGASVTAVQPGSMTNGMLAAGGVSDYFQFTLESNRGMAIYTSGEADTTGRLYNDRGMLLVNDENSGEGEHFRIDRPLPPGTYFIRVTAADIRNVGDYTLHVEEASMTTVTPGSMTDGILTAGVSSYFQFTLESARGLIIYTSGEPDTTGRLYDGRGMLLAADENSGEGTNFRINRLLVPGTYFIQVSGASGSVSGRYTLHVEGETTVEPGSMTDGIVAAGVSSYFRFTLESARRMAIYTSGEGDTFGELYDGRGMLLIQDFNSGEGQHFRIETILPPGTYLIRVSGAFGSATGTYTLHVEGRDTTVTPGSMTESTLPAGGSNYFRFTLSGTGTLESARRMAIYTSGGTNVTGRLYDARGMLLTTDENSGEGDNFRIESILPSGTYFIQVSGADASVSGTYTLHVEGDTAVTLGSMTEGMLAAGGSDYFRFTLTSAQPLAIYTSGRTNTTGRLYDDRGVLLASDSLSGAGLNFEIVRQLDPGTYFIRVNGADTSIAGDYTLHVEAVSATTVTLGSMTGSTLPAGGSDYFQFTLTSAQPLTIYTSGTTNTFGRLYDSNLVVLAADNDSGANSNFQIDRRFTPGTYFIRVTAADIRNVGDYTLHVEVFDITAITALTLPGMAGDTETSNQTPTTSTDYFRLQIETSRTLTIWSERSLDSGTLGITIYDAGLNMNPGDDEDNGSEFRISLEFNPGTYLLEVSLTDGIHPYKIHIMWEADDG